MKEFASEIRADRARKNLSQSDYGSMLGIGRATVALWETDGPGLTTPAIKLAYELAGGDNVFRGWVLEMAGLKAETPAEPEG